MISDWANAYDTWFTKPNHDLTPVIDVGVGKSLMALVILSVGFIESKVTVKPAKSAISAAKKNLLGLKITPFFPQR